MQNEKDVLTLLKNNNKIINQVEYDFVLFGSSESSSSWKKNATSCQDMLILNYQFKERQIRSNVKLFHEMEFHSKQGCLQYKRPSHSFSL